MASEQGWAKTVVYRKRDPARCQSQGWMRRKEERELRAINREASGLVSRGVQSVSFL